ncbi:hypothetical protein VNO78_34908 [Psophocarpus tetragonolobus]|uniref:Uncharacterized protein n=1 Tax=Psophocarpus tetragonolobus TaxID=3891 RepID=A0AAN9NUH7_PSOTE
MLWFVVRGSWFVEKGFGVPPSSFFLPIHSTLHITLTSHVKPQPTQLPLNTLLSSFNVTLDASPLLSLRMRFGPFYNYSDRLFLRRGFKVHLRPLKLRKFEVNAAAIVLVGIFKTVNFPVADHRLKPRLQLQLKMSLGWSALVGIWLLLCIAIGYCKVYCTNANKPIVKKSLALAVSYLSALSNQSETDLSCSSNIHKKLREARSTLCDLDDQFLEPLVLIDHAEIEKGVPIKYKPRRSLSQGILVTMTTSGLSGCALRCPQLSFGPVGSRYVRFMAGKYRQGIEFLQVERTSFWSPALKCNKRQVHLVKSAMDASYGDMANDSSAVFPRINVRDPYKRLGISKEASEDEIQGARNFLIQKYAGHKPSVDAIESAHDKIIMQKFYERKNPKIDIKKKIREVNQSKFVQAVRGRFQTPSTKFIIKTSLAFLVLGVLTVLFPTEEGPTLQVAISLIATIYFIHDRLKSKIRASLYGIGAFGFSWLLGTFLMVSVIPPITILKGPRAFEVISSLITYVLLWVSSTYLR